MGLFGRLKQFGERMEVASQQMINTQIVVTINNQEVKIGEEVSGTITVTSKIPCEIKGFSVNLLRESNPNSTNPIDKKQWVFNKENMQTPMQLLPGETKTAEFRFVVKDGLEYQPLSGPSFGNNPLTAVGLHPSVLPDPADGPFDHKINVTAQIEGAPIGPIGGINNINFVYPSVNISLNNG